MKILKLKIEMLNFLVLISLLANTYNVAAVTLNSTLLNQLGFNNQSSIITIVGQQITDIDPNAFKGNTNLIELVLEGNALTKLDLVVFKDSINLEILDMGINPLTQLTNTNKIKFPSLQILGLFSSLLANLDSNVINAFPNIMAFNIQNDNQLSPLKTNQLSAWKKLKYLYITTKNQISLSKGIFNGMNSLEYLSIRGSNIKTIEVHTLLALPNVNIVDFTNNALTSFEYLQIPNKLTQLFLSGNKMNYFRLSKTMGYLRYLYLDNNLFRSFKSMDFKFLANITVLSLSNNPLAYPNELPSQFEYLVNLQQVYLTNLSLSSIDSNLFKKNTNLNSIDLSNNKITVISYDALSHLKGLTSLDVYNNQISILDNRTFIGLNNFSSLNFQNNRLNKIEPRTFYNMTHLYSLIFSNNLISEIDSTAFAGFAELLDVLI